MEQQRTLKTIDEIFEVIVAAYKSSDNVRVYIPREIVVSTNTMEHKSIFLETKRSSNPEFSLISGIVIPGKEKMTFDTENKPNKILTLLWDTSEETDYCGMY